MGIDWLGYKLAALLQISTEADALTSYPDIGRLDTQANLIRALNDYISDETQAHPALEWPEAPFSERNISRWLGVTFQKKNIGKKRYDWRSGDVFTLPSNDITNVANNVTGVKSECLTAFIEKEYRVPRAIFLERNLNNFKQQLRTRFPAGDMLKLFKLVEMSQLTGLTLCKISRGDDNTTRLNLAPKDSDDVQFSFRCGEIFQITARIDQMSPDICLNGWWVSLFSLKDNGCIDILSPSQFLEEKDADIIDRLPIVIKDTKKAVVLNPKQGFTSEFSERGVVLFIATKPKPPHWDDIYEFSMEVNKVDSDSAYERAQLSALAEWIETKRGEDLAVLASAKYQFS